MQFSEDQAEAHDRLADMLLQAGIDLTGGRILPDAPGGPRVMAVLGKAGSGKTMLLARLVAELTEAGVEVVSADYEGRRRRERRSVAVLAPTNKAASVLRRRGVAATTIHRILYRPLYDPDYEKIAAWLADGGARPQVEGLGDAALDRARAFYDANRSIPGALAAAGLRGSDFIIGWTRRDEPLDIGLVDEASMLDDRQLDDLKQVFRTLILFGDPAQLAPVGQSGRMVFEALPEKDRILLRQVHRQAQGNPILKLAHALGDPALELADFETLLHRLARQDDRILVSPRADAALMARAPILVWRNATRLRLIQAFRQAYGAPADSLIPGEPLICDGIELPQKHRRKRIDLEARGLIKGAQAIWLGPGRRPGFSRLHVVGAEPPRLGVATIIKIESPDSEEPVIPFAARMGAAFLHGAAVTIHKAQGSQWDSVQVFAPDIFAAARSGRVEAGIPLWKRLAYVAITRAERRLIWVTRYRLARPAEPLGTADLAAAPAPLTLRPEQAAEPGA